MCEDIISKIAKEYNYDKIWERDIKKYLNNCCKKRRPSRSPSRSPSISPSRSDEKSSEFLSENIEYNMDYKKISLLKFIKKNKIMIFLKKYIKLYKIFVGLYLVLLGIYIFVLIVNNE